MLPFGSLISQVLQGTSSCALDNDSAHALLDPFVDFQRGSYPFRRAGKTIVLHVFCSFLSATLRWIG